MGRIQTNIGLITGLPIVDAVDARRLIHGTVLRLQPPTKTETNPMDKNVHDSHLETQALTATPQKLQLMLIEGAIRFANETVKHWNENEAEAACESLIRCRKIVSELLNNVRPDMSEAGKRAASVYLYLFQTLTDIQLHREQRLMADVLKVLEVERETWQTACDQIPEATQWVERSQSEQITSSGLAAIAPDLTVAGVPGVAIPPPQGLSLEA
jgi:flagellar protein FliS